MIIRLCLGHAPGSLSRYRPRVRVKYEFVPIKIQPFLRIIRAVQLVGVLKVLDIQSGNKNGIDASNPIGLRNTNDGIRSRLLPSEKKQVACGRAYGSDRKVDASAQCPGTIEPIVSGSYVET